MEKFKRIPKIPSAEEGRKNYHFFLLSESITYGKVGLTPERRRRGGGKKKGRARRKEEEAGTQIASGAVSPWPTICERAVYTCRLLLARIVWGLFFFFLTRFTGSLCRVRSVVYRRDDSISRISANNVHFLYGARYILSPILIAERVSMYACFILTNKFSRIKRAWRWYGATPFFTRAKKRIFSLPFVGTLIYRGLLVARCAIKPNDTAV